MAICMIIEPQSTQNQCPSGSWESRDGQPGLLSCDRLGSSIGIRTIGADSFIILVPAAREFDEILQKMLLDLVDDELVVD